jgi:Tfp pilus assembly protein PilX
MRGNSSVLKPSTSVYPNSTPQTNSAQPNLIGISLMIILPITVVLAIAAYRKHRATTLQQQIKRLNQLWRLDSSPKQS